MTTNRKNGRARTARRTKGPSARKVIVDPPEGRALGRILAERIATAGTPTTPATILPFPGAKSQPNAS